MVLSVEPSTLFQRKAAHRYPEIRILRKVREGKAARHDTNHGVLQIIERDARPNDVFIATETGLPQPMSQDHDRFCTNAIFVLVEVASEKWLNPEDIKHRRRHLIDHQFGRIPDT